MSVELTRHPSGRGTLLRAQVDVPRPLDVTFAFFADARNLEALTPPWLRFRIASELGEDGATSAGMLIDYRLRIRGVPIRWRTRIGDWAPPARFSDEQLRGPYRWWRHLHEFEALDDDATRMRDSVWYQPRGGRTVDRLLVAGDVRRIFEWREQRLLELLT